MKQGVFFTNRIYLSFKNSDLTILQAGMISVIRPDDWKSAKPNPIGGYLVDQEIGKVEEIAVKL